MIVVTPLLILVAVTLLVLGLTAGTSTMLIGSIVASLLAAVALVIGARRAATGRRATVAGGVPAGPEEDPFLAEGKSPAEFAVAGAATADGPGVAGTHTPEGSMAAASARQGAQPADYPPPPTADFETPPADFPPPPGADFEPGPGDPDYDLAREADFEPEAGTSREADPARGDGSRHVAGAAWSAGKADFQGRRGASRPTDADFAPPPGRDAGFAPSSGRDADFPPPPGRDADFAPSSGRDADFPPPPGRDADDEEEESYARDAAEFYGPAGARPATASSELDSDFSGSDPILEEPDSAPDYHRASSVIGGARSAEVDDSWRRDPDANEPKPFSFFDGRGPDRPLLLDDEDDAEAGRSEPSARSGSAPPADEPADPVAARRSRVPADEDFAEADEDDPEDEPLPQAVRPGDAVRVARMDDEVLVVDGRPRYHMADCHHLTGRLTESLPVSEAVELGFNPCGLCRPVDRLIAQTTHH